MDRETPAENSEVKKSSESLEKVEESSNSWASWGNWAASAVSAAADQVSDLAKQERFQIFLSNLFLFLTLLTLVLNIFFIC